MVRGMKWLETADYLTDSERDRARRAIELSSCAGNAILGRTWGFAALRTSESHIRSQRSSTAPGALFTPTCTGTQPHELVSLHSRRGSGYVIQC